MQIVSNFSGENKKNISNFYSAELAQIVVKVTIYYFGYFSYFSTLLMSACVLHCFLFYEK